MDDEVLAGLAALVGVLLAGEDEGRLDRRAVDGDRRLAGVLLDDREQVAEQAALGRREVGRAGLLGVVGGVLDDVDGAALGTVAPAGLGAGRGRLLGGGHAPSSLARRQGARAAGGPSGGRTGGRAASGRARRCGGWGREALVGQMPPPLGQPALGGAEGGR